MPEADLPLNEVRAGADLTWFQHDRFGLFVSWGISTLSPR